MQQTIMLLFSSDTLSFEQKIKYLITPILTTSNLEIIEKISFEDNK